MEISKKHQELIEKHFDSVEQAFEVFCIKLKRCPAFFLSEKANVTLKVPQPNREAHQKKVPRSRKRRS